MTIARRDIVDETVSGTYHCTSRCVRRAHLCGSEEATAHRREWIRSDLLALTAIFAISLIGFAIMGNHLHLILRTHPELVTTWTALEVVARWAKLHPQSIRRWALADLDPGADRDLSLDDAIAIVARNENRVASLRRQLSSISKLHQVFKQKTARRANLEDGCTGHFWEARFHSTRIVGDAALLATMLYVDLNPVRAGEAETPEASDYTSVQDRIRYRAWRSQAAQVEMNAKNDRQTNRRPRCKGRKGRRPHQSSVPATIRRLLGTDRRSLWLAPIDRAEPGGVLPMTTDDYLTLVDARGRQRRPGKRGAIDAALPPILERLESTLRPAAAVLERLIEGFTGTMIGTGEAIAQEARRRGLTRVVGLRAG